MHDAMFRKPEKYKEQLRDFIQRLRDNEGYQFDYISNYTRQ